MSQTIGRPRLFVGRRHWSGPDPGADPSGKCSPGTADDLCSAGTNCESLPAVLPERLICLICHFGPVSSIVTAAAGTAADWTRALRAVRTMCCRQRHHLRFGWRCSSGQQTRMQIYSRWKPRTSAVPAIQLSVTFCRCCGDTYLRQLVSKHPVRCRI